MSDPVLYLASPYSCADCPEVEDLRFEAAAHAQAALFRRGQVVYSPIAACHPVRRIASTPGDFAFWGKLNRAMIERCDSFGILTLLGYGESAGIHGEIKVARELGKPLSFISWEGLVPVETINAIAKLFAEVRAKKDAGIQRAIDAYNGK